MYTRAIAVYKNEVIISQYIVDFKCSTALNMTNFALKISFSAPLKEKSKRFQLVNQKLAKKNCNIKKGTEILFLDFDCVQIILFRSCLYLILFSASRVAMSYSHTRYIIGSDMMVDAKCFISLDSIALCNLYTNEGLKG